MPKVVDEGLDLVQQLAALPFKAARRALQETNLAKQPLGEVVQESLELGEGLAKLPFKAAAAILSEMTKTRPDLETRVANLEQRLSDPPSQP